MIEMPYRKEDIKKIIQEWKVLKPGQALVFEKNGRVITAHHKGDEIKIKIHPIKSFERRGRKSKESREKRKIKEERRVKELIRILSKMRTLSHEG
jgi:hypothetical protein